ncbi:MAG: VWA domain-containing protein, partial [Myxococcota bacterium]|nr:VWA domain-containing protein [Myxococcota bacterium]
MPSEQAVAQASNPPSARRFQAWLALHASLLAACAASGGTDIGGGGRRDAGRLDGGDRDAASDSGAMGSDDSGARADGTNDATGADGGSCEPPDVLVVLDRTMSMHRRPDRSVPPNTPEGRRESKWWIAVEAVEALTAMLDETIRFGLELFPRDPGGRVCVTLSERIAGRTATNPPCEQGEIVVPPALDTGDAIAAAIDPETTLLCNTTPIGAALIAARAELERIRVPGRPQYVLLVTDGQNSEGCPRPLPEAQRLAAEGIRTFVVGFDTLGGGDDGIDVGELNDLACAGRTAPDFPAPCTADTSGNYRATDRRGPPLFL